MVGFLGAIAGGAAKGWSAGQLSAIKAQREEKLKMLDMQFTHSENELTRQVQREQLASSERSTAASLGVQERLGKLQAETSKSNALLAATVNREEIGARKDISQATIDAQRELAQLQANTQLDLNIKPVLQSDGSTLLMRGKDVIHVYDPKTGKEIDPAASDDDTDQMRNYKFLASIGTEKNLARDIAFDTGRDAAELKTSLYNNLLKARVGDFGTADEEDETWARNKTEEVWKSFKQTPAPAPTEPAAGDPDAAAPAAPTSATPPDTTTVPHDVLLKQAVDGVKNGTLKREDARRKLLQMQVPEAKIKEAGL
jgi:hypothetical protein